MGFQPLVKLGIVAAAVVLSTSAVFAVPVYNSGGFETPRFTAGSQLAGQDVAQGPWLKDTGTSSALVTLTNPFSGTQAIVVTRAAAATGDTRWAVIKPQAPATGFSVFDIDADVRVQQATFAGSPPTNTDFGPSFGLEAYGTPLNALTPSILIGSLTIDATTGDVLYQAAGSGVLTETGTVVTRGAYHHLKVQVNFDTKQYLSFVDNTLVHTEPFVNNTAGAFSDAPIVTFAASATSVLTGTGTAYFDNYTINVIPEPTGFALAGVALAALSTRRRRQAVGVAA